MLLNDTQLLNLNYYRSSELSQHEPKTMRYPGFTTVKI